MKFSLRIFIIMPVLFFSTLFMLTKASGKLIYSSTNLSGHASFVECNPGGGNCECNDNNNHLVSYSDYGIVTSNPDHVNTYENIIGYKKFEHTFPDNSAIQLGMYKYKGEFRFPYLPSTDPAAYYNGQVAHMMIQLWDGSDALFQSENKTLEATIYLNINAWDNPPNTGKVQFYTIDNTPQNIPDPNNPSVPWYIDLDTQWHKFQIIADLKNKKYIAISIDNKTAFLNTYDLHRVFHDDWGEDVSLVITTESQSASPQSNCLPAFTWPIYYKNTELSFYEFLKEAISTLQIVSGMETSSNLSKSDDMNGDGKIGLEDAIFFLQKASNFK